MRTLFSDFPQWLRDITPYGPYRAVVQRVIDGDTVEVYLDLGFEVTRTIHVRLSRINAPEIRGESREAGLAAKAYLEGLLPPGTPCVLFSVGKVSFSRYVGELLNDTGDDVASLMADAGHAERVDR